MWYSDKSRMWNIIKFSVYVLLRLIYNLSLNNGVQNVLSLKGNDNPNSFVDIRICHKTPFKMRVRQKLDTVRQLKCSDETNIVLDDVLKHEKI